MLGDEPLLVTSTIRNGFARKRWADWSESQASSAAVERRALLFRRQGRCGGYEAVVAHYRSNIYFLLA